MPDLLAGYRRTVLARLLLLVEDGLEQVLLSVARRRGGTVRAHAFPGLVTGGTARVRGRVLLGADSRAPAGAPVATWSSLRANVAQFLTVEVPHARVRVDVDGRSREVVADREGYLDLVVEGLALAPGRHRVLLAPVDPAGEPAEGTLHVPHPDADVAVVSDIDDTVIDSGIAHGLLATLSTALLRDPTTRVPLDGAPELYRALADGGDGARRPFVYLSTSPWNLVGFLQRFLEQHDFPGGPLLLTDWGPGPHGLLRVRTTQHKLSALRQLAVDLPLLRFVLVGDSGQQDADIYTAFAREHPGRVAAVYVRRAGTPGPARQQGLDRCARELQDAGVPFVLASDSAEMLAHARAHGLARP